MNDRELLELAAKAAGITPQWRDQTLSTYRPGICDPIGWNPLTDDGDALRLMVKLGLHVGLQSVEAWRDGSNVVSIFQDGDDAYASTRRAIVRAAAEIGKAMP